MNRTEMLQRAWTVPGLRRALIAYGAAGTVEFGAYFTVIVIAYEVGGAGLAGIAAAAQLAPTASLVPLLARTLEKRRTSPMRLSLLWMLVTIGGLAFAASGSSAVTLIVVAAIRAIAFGVARPVHVASLRALSLRASDATAGLIVTGWVDSVSVMVGPALAGLALGLGQPDAFFWICAGVVSFAFLVTPQTGALVSKAAAPARSRPLLSVPMAKPLMAYKASSSFLSGATDVIIVLVAIDLLGLGEDGAGLIAGMLGAGELLGSVVLVALLGRHRLSRTLGTAAVGRGLFVSILGIIPGAFPAIVISGAAKPAHQVIQRLMVQRITPPDRQLRMFSMHEAFDAGGRAIGALFVPIAVAALGTQWGIVAMGLLLPLVFTLNRRVFRSIDQDAQVADHVLDSIESSDAFGGLSCDVIEFLGRNSEVITVPHDHLLVRQGDTDADRAWLLLEGGVSVWRGGEHVALLGHGSLVGEMALLLSSPRSADCITTEESTLLEITHDVFCSLVVGGYAGAEQIDVIAHDRQSLNSHLDSSSDPG